MLPELRSYTAPQATNSRQPTDGSGIAKSVNRLKCSSLNTASLQEGFDWFVRRPPPPWTTQKGSLAAPPAGGTDGAVGLVGVEGRGRWPGGTRIRRRRWGGKPSLLGYPGCGGSPPLAGLPSLR